MIIDLHRAEVTGVNRNGDETTITAVIATEEENGELIEQAVDVRVPIGAARSVSVGDTVTVGETPADEGSYFDLAVPTQTSFEQARQDRVMNDLLRQYDRARKQGLGETAAFKFACTAAID